MNFMRGRLLYKIYQILSSILILVEEEKSLSYVKGVIRYLQLCTILYNNRTVHYMSLRFKLKIAESADEIGI